jgi:acetyltransferase-like isoleucine patch superfamily enzyme
MLELTYILNLFFCDYGYNISCGENVYFNVNCVILDCTTVTIGSNVFRTQCSIIHSHSPAGRWTKKNARVPYRSE